MRAIVLDFDGLILDTEGALYTGWAECYAAHGGSLTADDFAAIVGTTVGHDELFDVLERQTGRSLDRDTVYARLRERYLTIIHELPLLPGVLDVISTAEARGMAVGVASNSTKEWVHGHLDRLDLRRYVHAVRCRDDVPRPKPNPDVYQAVLQKVGVPPEQALAFEDSPTGVAAARAAGCGVVAVPNPLTVRLDLSHAHVQVDSLATHALDTLITLVTEAGHDSGSTRANSAANASRSVVGKRQTRPSQT